MKEQLILSIVPSVLLAVVSFLLGRANKIADKRDEAEKKAIANSVAIKDGVCALLRVQLIEYHDRYNAEGKIPHYVMDNYTSMYDAYHALGGNGTVTAMYERLKRLEQY